MSIPDLLGVPPGFEHQPSKAILQSLAACQVRYFQEVEGCHCKENRGNTYGSSLTIRFRERSSCFFPHIITRYCVIDINE